MSRPHDTEHRLREAEAMRQRGRLADAQRQFETLLRLQPRHPETLRLLGVTLYQLRRFDEALARIEQAIGSNPRSAEAHALKGVILQAQGRPMDAIASYDAAIALAPRLAAAHNNRGSALLALNRPVEALANFDRALAVDPEHAETLNNRGNALRQLGRISDALACYDRLLAARPDLVEVLHNRGNVLLDLGRADEALAAFDRALALRPGQAETHACRAKALHELRRPAEAMASYDRALALRPEYAEALNGRATVLREIGRTNAAIADYQRALALKPDDADAHANLSRALLESGRLPEARAAIARAIALDPDNARHYHLLAEFHDGTADPATVAAMEGLLRSTAETRVDDRVFLHFALGKAFQDAGQHGAAFGHYRTGNSLKRGQLVYSAQASDALFRRIEGVFSPSVMTDCQGAGYGSDGPIFIVGMPRSGSTLIEQVLASHPDVYGGGEVSAFRDAVAALIERDPRSARYPEMVAGLDARSLCELATDYLTRLRCGADPKARITDKMLDNYLYLGLINLALPNARIVHVQRNPVDTCLSCFFRLFGDGGHRYSYDLGELGRYYRGYAGLMTHWRRMLPAGVMLDVKYEDVVADLEREARRIMAHCGLSWDPACLAFHKTQRPVRTLSMTQVRRPIYRDSVERRRHYGGELQPLLDALGEFAAT